MAFQRRAFLLPLVIWLVLGPRARADDSDEPVYDPGPGVTPPRVTHKVRPERRQSGRFRVSGKVVVSLVVSSAGLPAKVKIVQGMDEAINQTVIAAVEQWRFTPGKKDGKAAAVRITVEVSFVDL